MGNNPTPYPADILCALLQILFTFQLSAGIRAQNDQPEEEDLLRK